MDIRLLNSSTTSSAAASVAGASRTWSRKKVLTLPPRPLPAWMTRSSGRAWSELMPSRRRKRSAKALWTSKIWASGKIASSADLVKRFSAMPSIAVRSSGLLSIR